jgi:hypothetical protein
VFSAWITSRYANGCAAWKLLFDTLWTDFGPSFQGILESLVKHRDLIDREAVSFDILESSRWRARAQKDLDQRERERTSAQFQETLAWLDIEDRLQEDDFDSICQRRVSGTGRWILENRKFKSWAADTPNNAFLWMWGIPGSGMYVSIIYQGT